MFIDLIVVVFLFAVGICLFVSCGGVAFGWVSLVVSAVCAPSFARAPAHRHVAKIRKIFYCANFFRKRFPTAPLRLQDFTLARIYNPSLSNIRIFNPQTYHTLFIMNYLMRIANPYIYMCRIALILQTELNVKRNNKKDGSPLLCCKEERLTPEGQSNRIERV